MKTSARPAAAATPEAAISRQAQAQPDQRPAAVAQRQLLSAIATSPRQVAQRQAQPNRTGLPDHLKAGMENLSGHALDDVRVHRNSARPAQLQAHAYAQGTDIHLAPGQEKHLPHEAWHVVQQKQGRVKATMQLKGVQVNDNGGLEKEADRMGARAARHAVAGGQPGAAATLPQLGPGAPGAVVQAFGWGSVTGYLRSWLGGRASGAEEEQGDLELGQPQQFSQPGTSRSGDIGLGEMGLSRAEREQEAAEFKENDRANQNGRERAVQDLEAAASPDGARTVSDKAGTFDKLRTGASVAEKAGNFMHHGAVSQQDVGLTSLTGAALGAVGSGGNIASNLYGMATGNQGQVDKSVMGTSALSSVGSLLSGAGSSVETIKNTLHATADGLGGAGGLVTSLSDVVGGTTQAVAAHRRRGRLKPGGATENSSLVRSGSNTPSRERALLTDLAANAQAGKRRTGVGTAMSGAVTGAGALTLLAGASSPVGWGMMTAGAAMKGASMVYNKFQSNREAKSLIANYQDTDAVKQSAANLRHTGHPGPLSTWGRVKAGAAKAYSYLPYLPYLSSPQAAQTEGLRKQFASGESEHEQDYGDVFKDLDLGSNATKKEKYDALSS